MMNNNIKVKPKVWDREYTFEEYKRLNPHINENVLVNYYNRSHRVFLEDRSKHVDHFNNRKHKLSNEIKSLKEIKKWNNDGDQTVGPTGAGRKFRSPLSPLSNSLLFDQIDDSVMLNFIEEGRIPKDGTLKPYKGLTVAVWVNFNNLLSTSAHSTSPFSTGTRYTIIGCSDSQSGWALYYQNYRLTFQCFHTLTSSSPLIISTSSTYKFIQDYVNDQGSADNKQQFREDGWHYIVATWDGRDQKLWVDGIPSDANGWSGGINGGINNTHPGYNWNVSTGGGHPYITGLGHVDSGSVGGLSGADILAGASSTVSGSLGSIYYGNQGTGYLSNNHLNNVSIGANPDTLNTGNYYKSTNFWTGSIAEVAIWDKGLDAATINELWHSGISESVAKFDLSYPGYNNGENNHNHPYDTHDEGLSYKNIGRYANSLQGWWRLDNKGLETQATGSIVKDLSRKGRNGELYNIKQINYPPTGSYPGPTFGGGFDIIL